MQTPIETRIYKKIRENPDLCIADLARALGKQQSQISIIVGLLHRMGKLELVQSGNVKLVRSKNEPQ